MTNFDFFDISYTTYIYIPFFCSLSLFMVYRLMVYGGCH